MLLVMPKFQNERCLDLDLEHIQKKVLAHISHTFANLLETLGLDWSSLTRIVSFINTLGSMCPLEHIHTAKLSFNS